MIARQPGEPWRKAVYQELTEDDLQLDEEQNFGNLVTTQGRFRIRKIAETEAEIALEACKVTVQLHESSSTGAQ